MGAHNATTREYARRRVQYVIDRLSDAAETPAQTHWVDALQQALAAPSGGTLKAWMQAHEDQKIETLQVTLRLIDAEVDSLSDAWSPGPRLVDASRAASVRLNGSTRDYAGVTTMAATEYVYVGFAKWGSDVQMLCYTA